MSALTDALNAARVSKTPPFEAWVESLDEVDRVALIAAAPDPQISTHRLMSILRGAGCRVGRDTVTTWRKAHGLDSR
jgi:hypothetical protein